MEGHAARARARALVTPGAVPCPMGQGCADRLVGPVNRKYLYPHDPLDAAVDGAAASDPAVECVWDGVYRIQL